jgi:hypothetical protein
VLRDEFNLPEADFQKLKENELARISNSGVEIFNIVKNDSTMDKV